jgi:hypothetical protein
MSRVAIVNGAYLGFAFWQMKKQQVMQRQS